MCSELYFTVNHRLSSTWKVSNCFKTDYKTAFHLIMSEDLPLWVSCLEVMCHIWLLPRLGSNSSAASERKCVWESGWQRHFKEVQDVSNHLSLQRSHFPTLYVGVHTHYTPRSTRWDFIVNHPLSYLWMLSDFPSMMEILTLNRWDRGLMITSEAT